MLVGKNGKQFIIKLNSKQQLQTHRGVLQHEDLLGLPWGSTVTSHLGKDFLMVQPSLRDILLHTKRQSQIIYPKEIGYILLRLSIGPGAHVVECGTGSGALTTALAWAVGSQGKVYSYDRREDMLELASRNLVRVGLREIVELKQFDIEEGFEEQGVKSVFLDLPHAHRYLRQAGEALAEGGTLGVILPTANQVSRLLSELERESFALPEVCEILLRFYKPVPQRLRPEDRMVAHTGYLVFARSVRSTSHE
jgi:tRNA (adenine57-N1/adenine58-N1)-methyltransferase